MMRQGHHVLEGRGILADAAAAGAGEVAGVEGLQLEHHGEFGAALDTVRNDVFRDLGGQREGESHCGF
jgi:hypothetical protein